MALLTALVVMMVMLAYPSAAPDSFCATVIGIYAEVETSSAAAKDMFIMFCSYLYTPTTVKV